MRRAVLLRATSDLSHAPCLGGAEAQQSHLVHSSFEGARVGVQDGASPHDGGISGEALVGSDRHAATISLALNVASDIRSIDASLEDRVNEEADVDDVISEVTELSTYQSKTCPC